LVEGTWRSVGSPDYTEAQFQVGGLASPTDVTIDALWRGAVVAQFAVVGEPITALTVTWPQVGLIDEQIIAQTGSLPSDPAALERARRAQLLDELRGGLDQPGAFGDAELDRWLRDLGASSVSELIGRLPGIAAGAALKITFAPPGQPTAVPQPLPIAAAILIRDVTGFSLAELLSESKRARACIERLGLLAAPSPGTRSRVAVAVIWIVPLSLFDDSDWPGATAGETPDQQIAARRAAAGEWLAAEGIGLAAV
jgi:hypothetical protein